MLLRLNPSCTPDGGGGGGGSVPNLAAVFTGNNANRLATAANNGLLNNTGEFTIAGRIRVTGNPAEFGAVAGKQSDNYDCMIYNSRRFRWTVRNTLGVYFTLPDSGAAQCALNSFTFFVAQCSVANSYIRASVNAGAFNTLAFTGTPSNANQPFRVGHRDASDYPINADVDWLGVWQKLTSDAEITALYNGGATIKHAQLSAGLLTGLSAFYNMDEPSGDRLDSSGNGFTLVQTGTVPSVVVP